MGLQIRTYVDGRQEYIDLFDNETINLEVSFAEIQDIAKKNSAFTKDFNVPGSKNNNHIFNYFFDLNSVYVNWNPKRKFEADLLYDGYELYNGYIRMNSVSINKTEKVYNITFYNGVGDVAANIGDKFLRELDLSSLSHPFTPEVYLQSQLDPNLFPLTGTTNYSYQNGKTFWGLYNIGYNYVQSLSAITSYYQGTSTSTVAINSGQKTITTNIPLPFLVGDTIRLTNPVTNNFIEGIVQSIVGTTIIFIPNLGLGTGTYSNWNITRTSTGQNIPDPTSTPVLDFQTSDIPNFMTFSGTPIRNYYFKPSIQVKELYEQIFSQAGYSVDSEFFDTSYFEKYYLPLKFLDETVYSKGSVQPCYSFGFSANTPNSGVTCNNGFFSANTTSITVPAAYAGQYTFRVFVNAELSFGTCPSSGTYDLILNVNGNPIPVASITDCDEYPGTYYVDILGDITLTLTGTSILQIVSPSLNNKYFSFEIVNAPRFIVGNFDYASEFPDNDYKQIDFITSINKLFNLCVVEHPIKPKTLIVEPIIDYIGKGEILDWTDKIDWDSTITLNPTTNILNGTIDYNFRLDKDYGNQQFNIASNRIFGSYKKLLNQDYKDSTTNILPLLGSPSDIGLNNPILPAMTISNMAAIKNEDNKGTTSQQYNPYRILPRLVFRGAVIPNDNWALPVFSANTQLTWWAETTPISYWQEVSRFTTYPFAYSGFSHYINWNSEDTTDTVQSHFPTMQDMYDIYYSEYVDDIISTENKIFRSKIYLTPCDISNLRFNEKIIIRNGYYRINKITNLNLTDPSLSDVELIKLTRDYTSHSVKYFDLINCNTGGTDYHTTSDLNYNMYAYVGNYVNIFTGSTTAYTSIGCFEVVESTYNGNNTYESIFIGSGYTNNNVGVYSDCGCSGKTAFDIIQQI
jgi:hypothetical protein